MSTEFPFDCFPTQLFPEVVLKSVSIDETVLTISATESEWAIAPDMEYFFGPGDMLFHFAGEPSIRWKKLHETAWNESSRELLPHIAALEFIRRQDSGSWLFQFSNRKKGVIIHVILDEVERIEWTGEADEDLLDL